MRISGSRYAFHTRLILKGNMLTQYRDPKSILNTRCLDGKRTLSMVRSRITAQRGAAALDTRIAMIRK